MALYLEHQMALSLDKKLQYIGIMATACSFLHASAGRESSR